MESLHFTTFPDYKGDIFVNETWEIEKLHAFPPTAETKGALSLVKQSSFGTLRTDKNSLRHDANVTSVWGCELDYDEGVESFATASARFEAAGVDAFLHTSPRHTSDAPRWRVFLPFSQAFKGTTDQMRDYRAEAVRQAEHILGFRVADESLVLSQSFYLGRVENGPWITASFNGQGIDQKYDLRRATPRIGEPVSNGFHVSDHGGVDIKQAAQRVATGENLHNSLRDQAASFIVKGMRREDVIELLQGQLEASTADRDDRWKQRYDRIPVLVDSAISKFAVKAPAAGVASQAMPDELPQLDVRQLLQTQPPQREYHFVDPDGNGVLPESEGCGIAGTGGVGKSNILLDMAIALATGQKWLDYYRPCNRVPVFFFTKEDSAEELHRRLWAIAGDRRAQLNPDDLHIYPLLGIEFPLTIAADHMIIPGPATDRIIEIINAHGGSGMAIMDPLRKMTAGNEDGVAMTAAIDACDCIRVQTTGDCTTFLSHHSSKESMRNQDTTQGAFRGASDLVDGLRWTMTITKLSPKDRRKLPDGNNWRRIAMPKSNYTESNDDGVLVAWDHGRFVMQPTPAGMQKTQSTANHARQLYGVLLESGSLTKTHIRDRLHKDNGPIYAPRSELDEIINAAVKLKLIEAVSIVKENKQKYEAWSAIEGATDD